jgi:hypothetical protein
VSVLRKIIIFGLSTLFTAGTVIASQLNDWVSWNGYVLKGFGVNHFGEKFATTIDQWVLRGFLSPFAWPAIVLAFVFWLIVIILIVHLSRKVRRYLQRSP